MATSKKAEIKREETKVEPVVTAVTQPIVEETKVEESTVIEAKEEENPIPKIFTEANIPQGARRVGDKEIPQTDEEKILSFIEGQPAGDIKMNNFLKSLYPLPTMSEPAVYLQMGESRKLKGLLSRMQATGKITLRDNRYKSLGEGHYIGTEHRLAHYSINDVEIIAEK